MAKEIVYVSIVISKNDNTYLLDCDAINSEDEDGENGIGYPHDNLLESGFQSTQEIKNFVKKGLFLGDHIEIVIENENNYCDFDRDHPDDDL